ncbi:MAG: PorV/PorQ family protein [Elusimicrobia bacterium]|nr:PorV/PorQ family protein [Elusimicrobiota bacterium]
MRLLLAVLAFAAPAAAEGGRPGGVFDFAAAGRGAAMGGAFVALADDASSLHFNPAGLGRLQGQHLSLLHATLFEGASLDHLAYARQGRFGGLGAQFLRLSVGGIPGRDEFNNPTGGFDYQEQAVTLGYGTPRFLDGRLSVGGSAKVLQRALGGFSNRLIGIDVGTQYEGRWRERRTRLGLVARNLGALKMGDTDDRLPLDVRVGAGFEVLRGLTLGANVSSNLEFEFGTEYALGPGALRVGLQDGRPTFGGGVRFLKRWSLDMALSNHSVLGMTNLVSLGWRFGAERAEAKVRATYKDLAASADRALDAKRYRAAAELYERATRSTLADGDAQRARDLARYGRLRALLAELKLDLTPEGEKTLELDAESADTALKGVKALMEGEERKALLLAQAAYGADSGIGVYKALMDAVARLTFQKPRPDELFPVKTLVQAKLGKAHEAFLATRYDEASEHCREALMLEPESALAHERLGSLYFAMGLRAKAMAEWREAMRLDPGNSALKDFMRRILEGKP